VICDNACLDTFGVVGVEQTLGLTVPVMNHRGLQSSSGSKAIPASWSEKYPLRNASRRSATSVAGTTPDSHLLGFGVFRPETIDTGMSGCRDAAIERCCRSDVTNPTVQRISGARSADTFSYF
jgi:hypothetical protein